MRFTPVFPLDPGRQYHVRFDPARLPGPPALGAADRGTVGQPAPDAAPSTVVTRVYPTGDVVPENLLRMYIEFSAPMGRPSGIEYMKLLDDSGKEIPGAFLPLDYEFWSPGPYAVHRVLRSRAASRTAFCRTSRWAARSNAGRSVTLVISREWRDEHGLPLKEEFRRVLRVGPAGRQPLDTARGAFSRPPPAARDGVVVTFPEPLDHGAADARARRQARRRCAVDGDDRRRPGGDAVDLHATRSLARRHATSCSRSTSSRTSPAIRSAARSRWTTSTPSTRARTPRPS